MPRHYNLLDRLCITADNALRTLSGIEQPVTRPNPARDIPQSELSDGERRQSASMMRVNHTGEVCAQALYQGQALTAKLPSVRSEMEQASAEEIDHLQWCAERLAELDSHTSYLNPLFYLMSFSLGATAGVISDRLSLGFVAATEELVVEHLERHLGKLPEQDLRSRAIVDQMRLDEAAHRQAALDAGGMVFPDPVKQAMVLISGVMTGTVAHI